MSLAPQRILCPVDVSVPPPGALRAAAALASTFGAQVITLHVLPPGSDAPGDGSPSRARVEATRAISRVVDAPPPGGAITTAVVPGPFVATVLDFARRSGSDLIVIGHGATVQRRKTMVPTVLDIVRGSSCPVLYVPVALRDGLDLERAPSRIVCAIDFSVASVVGLSQAVAWAKASSAAITLVHVVEDSQGSSTVPRSAVVTDGRADAHAEVLDKLAELVAIGWNPGSAPTTVVRDGDAATQIVALAHEVGADTVMLGTHHRSRVGTVLFGSTVASVLQEAPCPVLLAR